MIYLKTKEIDQPGLAAGTEDAANALKSNDCADGLAAEEASELAKKSKPPFEAWLFPRGTESALCPNASNGTDDGVAPNGSLAPPNGCCWAGKEDCGTLLPNAAGCALMLPNGSFCCCC